jgi:hypothetical protein
LWARQFPAVYQKAAVAAWFLFLALKSRTFSPLNAARPKLANEVGPNRYRSPRHTMP